MAKDPAPYAVIADDLTGAGDAGVQFAAAGLRTRTLIGAWAPEHLAGAEVVVVDTASRGLAPAPAYVRVRAAAAQLQGAGCRVVYKKIDSTLRGPLGAEIDAVLDALGGGLAVVCPAYPLQGRTLVEGVLLVGGVAVAETAAAADPHAPVRASHLPTLLAGQTRRRVRRLPPPPGGQTPEQARARLAAELAELAGLCARQGEDGCIAVCDAESEADLAAIAGAASALQRPPLLVGSAGMARPLAALLARRQASVLVLCGSLHPAARGQVRHLQQLNNPGVTLLVTSPRGNGEEAPATAPGAPAAPEEPSMLLAAQARDWLEAHAPCGIVVTGGDTLHALLQALRAHGVDLDQEVAPGMPAGRIAGGSWAGLPIVSKAGGFGPPAALADAVQFLHAQQ